MLLFHCKSQMTDNTNYEVVHLAARGCCPLPLPLQKLQHPPKGNSVRVTGKPILLVEDDRVDAISSYPRPHSSEER
jgi:hypothetical protein